MPNIQRLNTADADFWPRLETLTAWEGVADETVTAVVRDILARVRTEGDAALLDYTHRFDRLDATCAADLEIPAERLRQALATIPAERRAALETAADRIRTYAERQKLASWTFTEADGSVLGQQVTPLDRVGLYVPGGKAAYPSSVLMNAIPAKVAGVPEVVMVAPTPGGALNDLVLAAAAVAEVDRVFTLGGAQAIAARSYLYYELERRGSITDGETDQVYTCGRSPTPAIYDAVRATAGVVARYRGEIVATFYVAGATQVSPSCAQPVSDRTTTERYVTYNLGRSGDAVIQSPLGYINPANVQNRGAMSQNGANCLADSGWRAADILRFYYGTDLTLTRALGPCVRDSFDSVPTLRAELQPPAGAPRTAGGERLDGRVAFGDPGAPQGAAGVGGVAAGGRSAAVGGSREAPDVAWPAPSTAAAPSKPARVVPSTTHEVEVPPPSERPVRLPRGVTPMPTTRRDTRPTATPARPQPGSGGTRPGERPIDWDPPFDPG